MKLVDHNRGNYEEPRIVRRYLNSILQIPEATIFMKYREEIWGRTILDIGCGAGRTAIFLSRWTDHYQCFDYSREMVEHCLRRVSGVDCLVGDVRDMNAYPDSHYDFVLFANNGLDALDHEDRLLGLRECHRTLKDGGLFVFSTHNSNYSNAIGHPSIDFTCDPCKLVRRFVRFHRCVRNRRRNLPMETKGETYRVINDRAHNFGLLTYYITQADMAAQLDETGFEFVEMYDLEGKLLDPAKIDRDNSWIHYVARKKRG